MSPAVYIPAFILLIIQLYQILRRPKLDAKVFEPNFTDIFDRV
jgi:hypothetical protein